MNYSILEITRGLGAECNFEEYISIHYYKSALYIEQSDLPNRSLSRNLQLDTLFVYMTAAYKLTRALDRVTVKRGVVYNGGQAK